MRKFFIIVLSFLIVGVSIFGSPVYALEEQKAQDSEIKEITPNFYLPFEDINVFVAELELGQQSGSYYEVDAYFMTQSNIRYTLNDFPLAFMPPSGVTWDNPQFFIFPAKNQVFNNVIYYIYKNDTELIGSLYNPIQLVWFGPRIYVYEVVDGYTNLMFDYRAGLDFYSFSMKVHALDVKTDYRSGYEDGQVDMYAYGSSRYDFNEEGSYDYLEGFDSGFDVGIAAGETGSSADGVFTVLMKGITGGIGSVLSFELLPGFSVGLFVLIPLLFGLLAFIVKGRSK